MNISRRGVLLTGVSALGAFAMPMRRAKAATGDVELTISFSYGPYKSLFDELARRFEASRPNVKINTLSPVMGTHEEHLQQVLRAAITGGLPDISFQGNHLIRVLVQHDLPVPLDPFIVAEKDWPSLGLTPGAQSVARVNGKTYGLSFQTSAPVIFYNAELVRQAGASPDDLPDTWPGVIALAKKIQGRGGGAMGGFFDYAASGAYTFQALLGGQGGHLMDASDKAITFNGAEGTEALKVLRQFATEGGMQDMTRDQAYQAFSAGTIGLMPTASSNMAQFEKQAGGRFQVLVGHWPVAAQGAHLPAGGRTVMIFTRDAEKQAVAWDYVKFVEGDIGQTLMVQYIGGLPSNEKAIADPALLGGFYKEHPNQLAAAGQLPILGEFFSFPGENTVKIGATINAYMQSVVTLKQTPETAMQGMVKDVQALLPQ